MSRLPARTGKQLARTLIQHGFMLDHVTGSHHIFISNDGTRRVTVPIHNRDIPKGTLHEILKHAGLSTSDL